MKFLADEGVDKHIVDALRSLKFDVYYVAERNRGLDDDAILQLANDETRILITRDKDFGELVHRLNKVHVGIILIRLDEYNSLERSEMVCNIIEQYAERLANAFSVIQRGLIRIR